VRPEPAESSRNRGTAYSKQYNAGWFRHRTGQRRVAERIDSKSVGNVGNAAQTTEIVAAWKSMDGEQGGDPAKLAEALVTLAALKEPPARFAAGADAVQTFEAKAQALLAQAQAYRELSTALAHENV